MESLSKFNQDSINILHKNNLLLPLIRAEVSKHILESVELDKNIEDENIKLFSEKYNIIEKDNLDKWLKSNNLEKKDFDNLALADIRIKSFSHQKFQYKAETKFLERKDDLDVCVYSLIRVKDAFKARELYLRVIEGEEDIGTLASKFSEGIEKKTRGVVGPIPLKAAHPILAKQLKNSQPGEVQPPIKIDNMNIVFRLEHYEPAKLDKLMRGKMEIELLNEWIEIKVKEINTIMLSGEKIDYNFDLEDA